MDYSSQINASMWLLILVQTIGAVDMPGRGPRKLPSPRAYVAIIVAWTGLNLLDDADMGRGAAAAGWAIALAALVIGPAGKSLTDFLNTVAGRYGNVPTSPAPSGIHAIPFVGALFTGTGGTGTPPTTNNP